MPNHPKSVAATAVSALKTVSVVTVIAAAAVSFVAFTLPYFLHLWKSVSNFIVPRYLFLVINSIIIVVWKLRGAAHHHDDDNSLNEDFMPYRTSSSGSQNFPSRLVANIEEDVSSTSVGAVPTDNPEHLGRVDEPVVSDNNDKSAPDDVSEDDDSMDAMWKAITGGRPFPNTNKNLTKSDTWEKTEASVASPTLARSSPAVGRRFRKSDTFREPTEPDKPKKEMRKSETFVESSAYSSSPARATGWRGRDRLVIGRDELFGKVEAFIKKNYEQMRLQRHERQESIRRVDTAY